MLKVMKMKLLLLIIDEIVVLCFDWCYDMLLMINYALGMLAYILHWL